jgi:predicted RNA-binding protein YlxR (DUF448 family)
LCAGSPACLDAALRHKAFSRALRTEIDVASAEPLRTTVARRGRMDNL